MKESFSKGIEQGIEQGSIQKSKTIALNMLNKNLDISVISEATGLSINENNELKDTE